MYKNVLLLTYVSERILTKAKPRKIFSLNTMMEFSNNA